MKNKQYNFTEYMDSSKSLLKILFGEEVYNKMDSTKLKSIDWDGIDIDCCQITATTPNVNERFSKRWIEYFKDHNTTLLDLYLQTIFHYGYQQSYDENNPILKNLQDMIHEFALTKKSNL